MREKLIEAFKSHAKGHIDKHVANVEVYLANPAGIGEHPNIMESLESELGKIAEYREKLDVLGEIV